MVKTQKLDGGLVVCVAMASGGSGGRQKLHGLVLRPHSQKCVVQTQHKPPTKKYSVQRVEGLTAVPPTARCTVVANKV